MNQPINFRSTFYEFNRFSPKSEDFSFKAVEMLNDPLVKSNDFSDFYEEIELSADYYESLSARLDYDIDEDVDKVGQEVEEEVYREWALLARDSANEERGEADILLCRAKKRQARVVNSQNKNA